MAQKITSEDLKDILVVLQEIAMNQAIIEGCAELLEKGDSYDLVIRMLKAYLQSTPNIKLQKIASLLNQLKIIMSMDEISEQIEKKYKQEMEMLELTQDLWR
jgi:hypothetical protein